MQINKVLSEICSHRGIGSSDQCYTVLYALVRAFNVKRVVEIGTHQAASTIVICQAIVDNKYIPQVWTIDNWIHCNVEKVARKNIEAAGFKDYVTMVKGSSDDILPKLFPEIGSVDMCFIDGNHKPEAVQRDIDNCVPYARRLILHDTPEMNPYLQRLRDSGWQVMVFPTRYVEGDGHFVGISLAVKE